MPSLNSSTLASCSYDEATRELTITFQSGATWIYGGVDKSVYDALVSDMTPGGYFHRHIKGRYPGRRE